MKTLKCITAGIALSALMFSVNATNITVSDGSNNGYSSNWYGTNEDNEVEPNCYTGQEWDLEAFLLDGTTLTVVSGYDLKGGYEGTYAGDLFVENDGTAGYDFVYDIDWSSGNYNLYEVDASGLVNILGGPLEILYNWNSNPVSYSPLTNQNSQMSGNVNYQTISGTYQGLLGASHNIASFDVSEFAGQEATFHLTMSCGNDNLIGHSNVPVPEPGTVSLMLLGLLSLGGCLFSRKNK
jgi:hypothetical protein